jgi:outer membrane protein
MLPRILTAQTSSDAGTVTRLTLADCVARALEDNRDVQIADKDLKTAEAQISEVYGRAYPQVDGNVNYTRNIKMPVMFLPPNTPFNPSSKTQTFELGSKNSVSAGVSARQALFDSQINTGIQLAKRYRQYAELSSQAKREQITRDVKVAFYQALLAQRLVEVSERSLELSQANHDNVKALYDNGAAAEFDFLRAEVQLANTSPVVSRNKNNFTIAVDDLKRIIGMEPSARVIIEGTLDLDTLSQQEQGADEQADVESNTTVRSLKAMEGVMQKNIAIESSAYFPTLSAFGSYDYQAQDNTLEIGNYEWVDSFVAGVTLSVPLFNGFQTKYRVAQAKLGKHRAILNRQQAEDGVRIQLLQARRKRKSGISRWRRVSIKRGARLRSRRFAIRTESEHSLNCWTRRRRGRRQNPSRLWQHLNISPPLPTGNSCAGHHHHLLVNHETFEYAHAKTSK